MAHAININAGGGSGEEPIEIYAENFRGDSFPITRYSITLPADVAPGDKIENIGGLKNTFAFIPHGSKPGDEIIIICTSPPKVIK